MDPCVIKPAAKRSTRSKVTPVEVPIPQPARRGRRTRNTKSNNESESELTVTDEPVQPRAKRSRIAAQTNVAPVQEEKSPDQHVTAVPSEEESRTKTRSKGRRAAKTNSDAAADVGNKRTRRTRSKIEELTSAEETVVTQSGRTTRNRPQISHTIADEVDVSVEEASNVKRSSRRGKVTKVTEETTCDEIASIMTPNEDSSDTKRSSRRGKVTKATQLSLAQELNDQTSKRNVRSKRSATQQQIVEDEKESNDAQTSRTTRRTRNTKTVQSNEVKF